jgi:hypothetical protein
MVLLKQCTISLLNSTQINTKKKGSYTLFPTFSLQTKVKKTFKMSNECHFFFYVMNSSFSKYFSIEQVLISERDLNFYPDDEKK